MTKGYIGKISAIVTVNTADAERAFNKSAADAQKFGANLQRTVSQATRDAGKSFDNIFTPLQKLQRAIQASKSANFNLGIKGLSAEELKRVEQLSLAARQLAAPLASAAKQFDGLGAAVQRGFSPALTATQTELLRVRDSMEMAADAGLEGFTGVARQVEKTVAAINQLAEASRQVASLPTGRELAFSDPRLAANLSAAQQAGRNALSLPAGAIQSDPQFSALTQQINSVSELAVEAAAKVKGAFSGQEAKAAQQEYDRLNTVLEDLVSKLNTRYQLFIDSEKSIKDAERLQKVLDQARLAQASSLLPAVLQKESNAISQTGETLAQYEARLQAQADAKNRAVASGQLFLRVLQEESSAISQTGESLDQYEARLRSLAIAKERAANNDRLINQERELAAARREAADSFAESRRGAVSGAASELTGRVQRERPTDEVFAGLPEQARRARVAVANAFRTPEADDLRNRLRQINSELENIASEEARLSAIDPLREQLAQWAELDRRIQAASDRLRAVEGLAGRASQNFTPPPLNPEVTVDVDVGQLEASADRIRAAFIDRIVAIDTAWDQAVRGLIGTTDELDQRFFGLLRTVDSLDLADRVDLDPLIADFRNAVNAGEGYSRQLEALLALEERLGQVRGRSNAVGNQGPPLPPGFRGQSDAGLGESLRNPLRQVDVLRSSIVSVKSQIDQLPAGLRQQFIPAIAAAETEFRRLAAAPNASAAAIDNARQRVVALAREATQAATALDFRRTFGTRQGVISSLEAQQVAAYTAQIQILQGEVATLTTLARGPAVAAISDLGNAIASQMERGAIATRAGQAEFQRLLAVAVRTTAQAKGISAGALGRTVARAGDVGRQGFANLSLGVQQAAFAFEDFFSVTGGLDQRIRAAGNNISQLGFVLGSTEGLIAGIAVAIGAQLVASIIKWTGVTEDAERRQRELKDALESTNGALERQRQLAEQLRDTYRELAKSIAEAGAPEAFRDERQRREQIAAVQREQEDRRRAGIEANSPQIAQQRGRIAEIDRQLETEQNAATRQRLIERRNAADAAVRREIDDVERRSAQNARVSIERNAGIDGALRDQQGRRDALRGEIGGAARRGNEAEVNRLSRELAVIETTILRLRDAAVRIGAERGQDIIGGINRTQANIENVPGIRQLDVFSSVVRTEYERFSNLLKDGQITFQEFNNAQQRLAAVGERAERASAQLGVFADALQSAAGSLARAVEQELRGRVDSQRREANAAEARFGTNDPRAQLARRQQQQSEEIARRGTRDREAIDAEISRQRRNFESAALDGRGGAEANGIGERLREIGQALSRQPENRAEANQQERLRLEADVLRRQLGELFNATPGAQQLNRQANLADIRGQQGIQGQEAVRRGFEASITPAQRAGEELGRTLFDLKAAFDDGAVTLEQYNAAVKRNVDEQSRAIAPAIFGLADQVQNAVLQGPSRAALNVSDVSTVEGSRELNRLLRGDDAALQQASLQELQKQSELLREALAVAKEQAAPKVVDLK